MVHITGVDNITCDGFSRDVSLEDLGFTGDRVLKWEDDDSLVGLLNSCAPNPAVDTDEEVTRMWNTNEAIVKELHSRLQ